MKRHNDMRKRGKLSMLGNIMLTAPKSRLQRKDGSRAQRTRPPSPEVQAHLDVPDLVSTKRRK